MRQLAIIAHFRFARFQFIGLAIAALFQRGQVARLLPRLEPILRLPFNKAFQFAATAIGVTGAPQALTGATQFSSNPTSPATAKVGEEFSMAFTVTGTPETVSSWRITGALPPGLSIQGLNGTSLNGQFGIITGTPTTPGNYRANAQAFNGSNQTGDTDGVAYPIIINVENNQPPIQTTFNPNPSNNLTTTAGTLFSMSFGISGISAKSWEVTGAIPPGLQLLGTANIPLNGGILNGSVGTLTGTPTTAGNYTFNVKAYDGLNLGGAADPATYSITVHVELPPLNTVFVANPASTISGKVGTPFSMDFSIIGMTPASWKVTGSLPPGAQLKGPSSQPLILDTLNASSGTISGVPSEEGEYSVTLKAFEGINLTGRSETSSNTITIVVAAAQTPLQVWKTQTLGDENAPDDGDPDRDGLPNIFEYILNKDPNAPTPSTFLAPTLIETESGIRARTILERDTARSGATIQLLAAASPTGPWLPIATSENGAPFTGPAEIQESDTTGTFSRVEITDSTSVTPESQRYLRWQVMSSN